MTKEKTPMEEMNSIGSEAVKELEAINSESQNSFLEAKEDTNDDKVEEVSALDKKRKQRNKLNREISKLKKDSLKD